MWVLVLAACGDNVRPDVIVEHESMRVPLGLRQSDKVSVTGYAPEGAARTASIDDGSIANVSDDGAKMWIQARKVGQTTAHFQYGDVEKNIAIEVTQAEPQALEIQPATMTLPLGTSGKVAAILMYTDGTTQDVTDDATWQIDDDALVAFDPPSNMVSALAGGSTKLHADYSGMFDATASITVPTSALARIELDPPSLSLPMGAQGQLKATGFFSDGSFADVTAAAVWTSDSDATAAVLAGTVKAVASGTTAIHASVGPANVSAPVQVTSAELLTITIDPASGNLPINTSLQLTATGHYADGSTFDLTNTATWASDAKSTVSQTGLVTGVAQGFTTVTATQGEAIGTAIFNVTTTTLLRLEMSDATLSLPVTTQHQLTAIAVYNDNTTFDVTNLVTWTTADATTASVSHGLVTAVAMGGTTITATMGANHAQTAVTVTGASLQSIDISPAASTMPMGTTQQLIATAHFGDGSSADITTTAMWSSSAPLDAFVGNANGFHGLVTALLVGDATITATMGTTSATATVHVSAALATQLTVTPMMATIAAGAKQQLTAIATFSDNTTLDVTASVAWVSQAALNASVSNAAGTHGQVTGLAVGTATVTAGYGALTASSQIIVTAANVQSLAIEPATLTVARGGTGQLKAMATYSDNSVVDVSEQATWTSDSSNASVSNVAGTRGKVVASSAGAATVTAALGTATATAPVTVTPATLLSIHATPNPLVLQHAATSQLAVQGLYSDLSTADRTASSSFVSANPAIATVSPAGVVTATATGITTITVTNGAQMTIVAVTVTPAILVSLTIPGGGITLPKGLSAPLTAIGTYSDGSTADLSQNVTFTSSNSAVASVANITGNVGLLNASSPGSAVITAHLGDISASVNVNVTNAALTGITVDANAANLLVAQVDAMTATGHYTDGTTQDLTNLVSWGSSNPGILSISNLPGLNGKAIGLDLGSTNVTASLGTILGTQAVMVGSGCHIVVNEVKTGSLLNGKDEFIEIFNPCAVEFSLDGDTLVYRTAVGTTDTVLGNLAGTMEPGEYLVYGNSGFTGTKDGSYTTDLAALGGGIAIRASATSVIDSVGYGVAVNAYVETAPVLAAPLGQAIARKPNGVDTNDNLVDFAIQAPTPHAAN